MNITKPGLFHSKSNIYSAYNIKFYDNYACSTPTPRSLLFFTILNQLLTTKDSY